MLPLNFPAWPRGLVARLAAPALLLALALPPAGAQAPAAAAAPPSAVVQTPELRAELVVHAPEGLAPAKPMWLGLALKHSPRWHTYWKNPGDSGLPTRLQWTLPEGVAAGEIAWPAPKRQPFGPMVNYGYEGEQLLPVPLTLPAGWTGPTLAVRLHAEWLVCAEVCLPQAGDFVLEVPAGTPRVAHAAAFAQALAAVPRVAPGVEAQARVDGPVVVVDVAGLPEALRGKPLQLFAEQAGVIDHAAPATLQWQGDRLRLRQALSPQRSESPERLQLVLAAPGAAGAVQLVAPVAGGWPAPGTAAGASPGTDPATPGPARAVADSAGAAAPLLPLTLVLAFVGGLLLNLMPCVFPVLSLKVIGLTSHGGQRRALVAGGLAYTAGVVLSFVLMAVLLLALRAGGAELGWGFQLQSPGFVAALALLFTLIGLNLAGVIGLSGVLPQGLSGLHARRPLLEHALTGVLAAVVASPCTAPFMGAALGVALTQPAPAALAVFVALGLGMAAPYLAVSCWPRLARALPRPGAWMEQLKIGFAFPMFGTVVWLLWVFGQQVGLDGAAALLGLLVGVAFVAWAWAAAGLGRRTRQVLGSLALLLLGAGLLAAWPALRATPAAGTTAGAPAAPGPVAASAWQPWSPDALAQAQAQGRPVLVDFTAAWCVTCQFNKHGALADAGLLADLQSRSVLLLRADWTRRDDTITQALAALGRNGVPVYALYPPGGPAAPVLLPEILTVAAVRGALARWPASAGP